jgi:putative ABC transport system ATP-binding protein
MNDNMKYNDNSRISLSVTGLKKTFVNGRYKQEILRNINFDVKKGEWVAIMGPSGSGKTTLLNILGLLDQNYEKGEIKVNGTSIKSLKSSRKALFRSKHIGMVFQNHFMIETLTARENIELPFIWSSDKIKTTEIKQKVDYAIEIVGLKDKVDLFPEELSGGEQQRFAIARAIVNNPEVVLLDEPTGNLDTQTGKTVLSIFRLIASQGASIIMVTHDPEAAKLADRILLLKNGNIISLRTKTIKEVQN